MESGLEREDDSFLQLFCYCHFVIRQDRSRSAGLKRHFFLAITSEGRSSVPSSAFQCAENLVNIRSTQKLSWISLFHARGRRMPSFWVTGTTRFESVDIICQIWPIRGYTRSWYTSFNGSSGPALPSFFPFYFRLRPFSIQRFRLSRSLEQAIYGATCFPTHLR